MTDFDFDELDKAVNGAIGKKPTAPADTVEAVTAPEPVADETTAQVDAIDASSDVSTPEAESTESEATAESSSEESPKITGLSAPVETTSSSASAPAIKRSSGRFMDMVHPKSDMLSRSSDSSLSKGSASVRPEPTPAPIEPLQSIEEVLKPLESPFLPDTKVEKRPLGGLPSLSQFDTSELLEEPNIARLEAPDDPRLEAETMPDPIDFAIENGHVDLDLEAEKRAVAEETPDDATEATTEPASTVDEKPEEALETPAEEAPIPEESVEVEAVTEPEVPNESETTSSETPAIERDVTHAEPTELVADQPTGPTSITQQYQEQAASKTTESGAIFDTEAYHQPLAQSVKKKSGIWVVIWIILLVVLGAGAGAAFYLYVLPLL